VRHAAAVAEAAATDDSAPLDDGWKSNSKGTGGSKRHKIRSPGGTQYSKAKGRKKHDARQEQADPAATALHSEASTTAAALTFGSPIDSRVRRGLVTAPNETTTSVPNGQAQPTPTGTALMDLQAVDKFVTSVNAQRRCSDRFCQGQLVPYASQAGGLGGAVKISYQCDGTCESEPVVFDGTGGAVLLKTLPPELTYDRETCTLRCVPNPDAAYRKYRSRVGLSMAMSFLLSGKHFSDYFKQMTALGAPGPYNRQTFLDLVKYCRPFSLAVLQEDILAAQHWHELDDSWDHITVTGDGVWQTRKFSKNGTYIVNDYELDGALVAVAHACMKGDCHGDGEIEWAGTS
jgi:hypothetical protein